MIRLMHWCHFISVFWCFQGGRERVYWEQVGYTQLLIIILNSFKVVAFLVFTRKSHPQFKYQVWYIHSVIIHYPWITNVKCVCFFFVSCNCRTLFPHFAHLLSVTSTCNFFLFVLKELSIARSYAKAAIFHNRLLEMTFHVTSWFYN